MSPGDHIKSSNYTFESETELSILEEYADHRRLGVFFHKGTVCANPDCDCVGTRMIYGRDKGGSLHLDLYTDDLILMTVDHVIPRSLGGSDCLNNKEPMCTRCNSRKGNRFIGTDQFHTIEEQKIAKTKARQQKQKNNYGRMWRKFIRKTDVLVFVGKGELLLDKPLPSMRQLQSEAYKNREAKRGVA